MIVKWLFYLFWAASVFVAFGGILKFKDITRSMMHVPVIGMLSLAYFTYVYLINCGAEGLFSPDMTLGSFWLGLWLPMAVLILGAIITSVMYGVYGIFTFSFSPALVICAAFLTQSICAAVHVVFYMPNP